MEIFALLADKKNMPIQKVPKFSRFILEQIRQNFPVPKQHDVRY